MKHLLLFEAFAGQSDLPGFTHRSSPLLIGSSGVKAEVWTKKTGTGEIMVFICPDWQGTACAAVAVDRGGQLYRVAGEHNSRLPNQWWFEIEGPDDPIIQDALSQLEDEELERVPELEETEVEFPPLDGFQLRRQGFRYDGHTIDIYTESHGRDEIVVYICPDCAGRMAATVRISDSRGEAVWHSKGTGDPSLPGPHWFEIEDLEDPKLGEAIESARAAV